MVRRLSIRSARELFSRKIAQFPLLQQYLAPSLRTRLQTKDWFENRVVRYVLRNSSWIHNLEKTFQEAQLDSIGDSEEIFDVLNGTAADYDESVFDALAEVRLAAWARSNNYKGIKKLKAIGPHSTPDFCMSRPGCVALAEAKHFRVRDYLVYFVAERLEGLALVTGGLTTFGLLVETGHDYNRQRDNLVSNRNVWICRARAELTEDWLRQAEGQLESDEGAKVPLLDGLFVVRRSATVGPGRLSPALMGMLSPKETVQWCLSRLKDALLEKLRQIKAFMTTTGTNANQVIVFLSGIDEWEPEWSELWETLDAKEQWAWDCVGQIKNDADALIRMPFELIIGRYQKKGRGPAGEVQYGPMQYGPFLWKPQDL